VNCDVHGHVLRSSYNLPVLYSYCNSFLIRDVDGEFGLFSVRLFNISPAILSRNVRDFFVWRGNPVLIGSLVLGTSSRHIRSTDRCWHTEALAWDLSVLSLQRWCSHSNCHPGFTMPTTHLLQKIRTRLPSSMPDRSWNTFWKASRLVMSLSVYMYVGVKIAI